MSHQEPTIAFLDSGRVFIAKPGQAPVEHESDFVRNLEDRRATEVHRKAWQQGSDSWNTSARSGPLFSVGASNETENLAIQFSSLHSSPNGITYLVNAGTVCALLEFDPSDETERRIKHDHSPFAAQISHAHTDRFVMSRRTEYGHSHIAIAEGSLNTARAITSGDVLDDAPMFHPNDANHVVYHSSGISRSDDGAQHCLGPSKIIKLELEEDNQVVVASSDERDYLAPKFMSDGSVLCLERPWEPFRPLSTFQSIKETLMIPFAYSSQSRTTSPCSSRTSRSYQSTCRKTRPHSATMLLYYGIELFD